MTEPLNKDQLDKLVFLYQGNANALKYVLDVLYAGHLLDDLIDKDRIRTDEDIMRAFRAVFGDIPLNPFYQAFHIQLAPLMMSACLLWEDSVKLEKGGDNEKMAAFIMRNALGNIAHFVMFLVGGQEWMKQHGHELWQIFDLYDKWSEFRRE